MNARTNMESTRREERVALEGEVRSRHPGSKAYPTTIRNLSPGGCCVDLSYSPKHGERLWVTLPGLQPIEAQVCWNDGWTAGCAFTTPLYPAVFDTIRQRMEETKR
ncbi:PilZ domain-containing protein [Sphingomicrobium sediminis]|uniref:PilZ domain-containing protein n=1 Tax=Sphingomicrobium sediminis TaxID=2950949 RepID=A0A9X2EHM7_9SPHN|nr:PilZ domain-containing protein [Sphingomicrobium sediminis]MCM8557676.1 PilZ domain-containing protein [Sphingomicrobium sediminis]